jgi:hypothetical protein
MIFRGNTLLPFIVETYNPTAFALLYEASGIQAANLGNGTPAVSL